MRTQSVYRLSLQKAIEMHVTVLHLQDDLEAARMARFVKSRFSEPRVSITPKYGPVRIDEIRSIVADSDAIVLYVIDPSVEFDRKTLREVKVAKEHGKPIYVVSSGSFKMPKVLSDYDQLEVYVSDSEGLAEALQRMKRAKKNKNFWRFIYHLLSLANLNSQASV